MPCPWLCQDFPGARTVRAAFHCASHDMHGRVRERFLDFTCWATIFCHLPYSIVPRTSLMSACIHTVGQERISNSKSPLRTQSQSWGMAGHSDQYMPISQHCLACHDLLAGHERQTTFRRQAHERQTNNGKRTTPTARTNEHKNKRSRAGTNQPTNPPDAAMCRIADSTTTHVHT
jgi:hypothetical protein